MIVSPAAFAAVPGRVPELWIIVPGNAPKSLGLLHADRAVTIAIPAALLPQTNTQAVLAVTIEQPGGSTTGAPTGPVVAQGKLTNL
jgi:anti-sigma-K factor RskA